MSSELVSHAEAFAYATSIVAGKLDRGMSHEAITSIIHEGAGGPGMIGWTIQGGRIEVGFREHKFSLATIFREIDSPITESQLELFA